MTTIYIFKIFKYERLLKLKIKKQLSRVNMKKILETMLKIQFYTYIHTYIYKIKDSERKIFFCFLHHTINLKPLLKTNFFSAFLNSILLSGVNIISTVSTFLHFNLPTMIFQFSYSNSYIFFYIV